MIESRPHLSDEQQAVVAHPVGRPAVIVAGAGTGKTFTIVERVAALHESGECPAAKVLLLTFARKAAAELRRRIAERLNTRVGLCSTFHAFAWKILSTNAYDIGLSPDARVIEDVEARVEFRKAFYDYLRRPSATGSGFPLRPFNQDELRESLFAIAQDLKQRAIPVAQFRAAALAATVRFATTGFRAIRKPPKNGRSVKPLAETTDIDLQREVQEERLRIETAANIFDLFDERLAANQALTYADILVRAEQAIRADPNLRARLCERYSCCIVDEYQDTDLAQHRFLEAIYGSELSNVMVVGDVLQSIYAFRGAHPANIEILKRAPAALTYTLVKNRRSRQEILELAHAIVVRQHADALPLVAERGAAQSQIIEVASLWDGTDGRHLLADEARVVEAAFVAHKIAMLLSDGHMVERKNNDREALQPADIAILSRTKLNVQPVTAALLEAGIPFRLVGGVGFYDAPEIRDALAWIRLLADPLDALAISRALQSPVIGLSDVALSRLALHLVDSPTALARRVLLEALQPDTIVDSAVRAQLTTFHDMVDALAPFAALPLISAVHAVLTQTGLQAYWHRSSVARAPQACANLEKLESLARGFAADTPGAQPADFVAFIAELERVDYDEREADVPGHNAVTISTIHAAKGLEWPVVFVLGVWPAPRPDPRLRIDPESGALIYAESPDGSRPFHYSIIEHHADEGGIAHEDQQSRAKGEREAEESRLFYVALTRARDLAFVSGLRGKPSRNNPLGAAHRFLDAVYLWLHERQWTPDYPAPAMRKLDVPVATPALVQPWMPPQREPAMATSTHVPPLSYSLVAAYERCPRQATYRLMYRLPDMTAHGVRSLHRSADGAPLEEPLLPDDSLLQAGEYGLLLHKALELWASRRRQGVNGSLTSDAYVEEAARILGLDVGLSQQRKAESVVSRVMRQLVDWKPLEIEAPFMLDFGSAEQPLLVSGFIDLLALDQKGRPCVVDYKSGTVMHESHALQIALYRRAAALVYGQKDALGFIGRVSGDDFSLDGIEPVSAEMLAQRVIAARDGLRQRTDVPHAGPWCFQCAYRNAPCHDYFRQR